MNTAFDDTAKTRYPNYFRQRGFRAVSLYEVFLKIKEEVFMTGLEALQAVQYVTVKKKRFAVIEGDMWEKLLEWLESVEDSQIIKQAYSELAATGGNRERAGWLRWDDVREELN